MLGRHWNRGRTAGVGKSSHNAAGKLLLLSFVALVGFAQSRPALAKPALTHAADDLEVQVWTADEQQLPDLEREVTRIIQTNPHSAMAHHLLSHILVRFFSKDPNDLYTLKQATDLAQQAIDLAPKQGIGYVAMADIMDLMGNASGGIKLLNQAETSGVAPNWRFYFTRARLLADTVGSTKALGLLETALAFTDAKRRIIAPYVVAILQAENTGKDLAHKLEDWNHRFPSPLFQLTAAITLSDLGEYQQAHALYKRIIKADPSNKEAMVNDAILLYRNLKESAKATKMLENVLARHGEDLAPSVHSMVLAHLGAAYLQRQLYAQAEQSFVGAFAFDTGNPGVLDFTTHAYRGEKAYKQLAHLLRTLNDIGPGSGVLYALLGETLSEDLSQQDAAIKSFSDAIILDPDRSDYYNGMGLAYYRKKVYPKALKLFNTATDIDPNDATARYNEACVLALMGKSEDAIAALGDALSLDPRLTQNARKDSDFQGIRGQTKFRELVQGQVERDPLAH